MEAKKYNVYEKVNLPIEEAIKTLRANIQFCSNEKRIKTLAVVSYNPKEGKTSVAINLSISMAKTGIKTLFVDADMRKPMVAKRLGSKEMIGLSSYLRGSVALDEIICETSVENLYYVSCGPKAINPAELINSFMFTNFLRTIENVYDIVIIDTSALGSVIDGAIIASQTDGTLMVISSRKLQAKKAERLKEQLDNANARIIGVVLNKVSKRDYNLYNSLDNSFYYQKVTEKGIRQRQGGSNSYPVKTDGHSG